MLIFGNYKKLKQAVADVIKANGQHEITGNVLQQTLLSMVNALGLGAQFTGFATVATVPGSPDEKKFYLATNIGTYTNFNNFVLSRGVALFTNITGAWVGTQIDIPNILDINGYAVQQSPTLNYVIGYINTTHYELNYTPMEPLNKVIKLNVTPGQVLYVTNDRTDNHNYMLDGNGKLVRRLNLSAGTTKITVGESEAVFWFAVSYKSAPGDPTKQDIYTVPKGLEDITTALESMQESIVNIEKVTDNFEVVEKISKLNLLNPDLYIHGVYIDAENVLREYPALSVSGFIPVVAGQQYRIFGMSSNGEQGYARYVNFYTGAQEHIPGTQVGLVSTVTIPEGCKYIRCSNYNGLPPSTTFIYDLSNTGVMLGASPTFEKYFLEKAIHYDNGQSFTEKNELTLVNKSDIQQAISGMGGNSKLTVEFANPGITVKRGSDYIAGTLNKYAANNPNYAGNPMFNFVKWRIGIAMSTSIDDVAPMHVQNTTIGANHAQPCMIGTINAHGKDNTAIGTEWTHTNGTKFYIMRIVDENKIVFLSENTGTPENQTFVNLSTGTLTNGSQTMTVSAVASTQLFESVFNVKQKVLQNGVTEITEAQTFGCDFVDVVEEYDIVNTAEVLNNIIARAGQTGNPVYTSNPMIHVENIYRFLPNLSVVVTTNVIANQTVKMNDIMFSQASPVGTPLGTKYYAPNSLPVAGYDFRKPLTVRWSSSVPSIYFTSSNWADADNPVNRIVQIAPAVGFALGFLKAAGVGKDLKTFTGRTFELRNTSGKVYPHGVDSIAQGDTLTPGKMYTAVMYRCFFDVRQPANRLSMYNCTFNGAEYVFVDYSATTLDRVVVDAALDGKQIEVVEAKNAELKTDVYNNGFYVNATYVEGETCFIVVKIG
nr:MAG: hypothetical protein [Bacteriophage sp.]